jgi:hypothetical protein
VKEHLAVGGHNDDRVAVVHSDLVQVLKDSWEWFQTVSILLAFHRQHPILVNDD